MSTPITPKATTTRTPRVSVAGSKQTQQFSALTKGYSTLGMADNSSWIRLVQSVNLAANRTGRQKLSAANLYTKVNTVRLACNKPLLSKAPASLPPAPSLPAGLTVRAALQGPFFCGNLVSDDYPAYV